MNSAVKEDVMDDNEGSDENRLDSDLKQAVTNSKSLNKAEHEESEQESQQESHNGSQPFLKLDSKYS